MNPLVEHGTPIPVSGIYPHLAVSADPLPVRTESGIGALMPWAGRLWFITYVAHLDRSGSGTGLFELDANLTLTKRAESVVGTYANRMIHSPSDQLLIGPHVIDVTGNVRTIEEFSKHRLAATMEHLTDPEDMAYYLTMEGILFEVNVHSLQVTKLFDLNDELGIPSTGYTHFKAGHTSQNRVVVANNTYESNDFLQVADDGRLAEWDGTTWTVIKRKPFHEVTGRKNMGEAIFASGWDRASAILEVCTDGRWTTYRLPKASHTVDHMWTTEWPRIREVESERYLLDTHMMFYELSPLVYGGKIWGVRPISTHLRIIPDFCSWRGMLVLAGNQTTPIHDTNLVVGEPQSNLWFGKTDDLWSFGKPKGWGGPWWEDVVSAGTPSDPYLMTGFEHKVLHLRHDNSSPVTFSVEVDFLGTQNWAPYDTFTVAPGGYIHHEFPNGFSAHWVRVTSDSTCRATAQFTYT